MTRLTQLEQELEDVEIQILACRDVEEIFLDKLLSIRRSRHPEEWDVAEDALGEIQDEIEELRGKALQLNLQIDREDDMRSFEELGWSL